MTKPQHTGSLMLTRAKGGARVDKRYARMLLWMDVPKKNIAARFGVSVKTLDTVLRS